MEELIEKIKAKRIELRDAEIARVNAEVALTAARRCCEQIHSQVNDLMTEFQKAVAPPIS